MSPEPLQGFPPFPEGPRLFWKACAKPSPRPCPWTHSSVRPESPYRINLLVIWGSCIWQLWASL